MRNLLFWSALLTLPAMAGAAPRLSSPFGYRVDPIDGRHLMHSGIDLPSPAGTPVRAAAGGVVRFAGLRGGYGLMIELQHPDGSRTRYAHLSRLLAGEGEAVAAQEVLGLVGSTGRSTGSHLHFEYWVAERPVDPLPYMDLPASRVPPAWGTAARVLPQEPHRSAFARARDEGRRNPAVPELPDGDAVAMP